MNTDIPPTSSQVILDGAKSLAIGDPGLGWLVTCGHVDLFLVKLCDSRPIGPRRHIARIDNGGLFFGMVPVNVLDAQGSQGSAFTTGVIAVGSLDTEVATVSLADLIEKFDAAVLIDGWIELVSVAMMPTSQWPERIGEPGQSVALPDQGRLAGPARQITWIEMMDGVVQWLDRDDAMCRPGEPPLPLGPTGWVRASGKSTVRCGSTLDVLARHDAVAALDRFHVIAMAVFSDIIAREEAVALAGMVHRARADELVFEAALGRLSEIVRPGRAQADDAAPSSDAMVCACRQVAAAQGLTLTVVSCPTALKPFERLDLLARANRVRIRRVLLRERWWVQDNGPLIGFMADTHAPVALLPADGAGGGYIMADAKTNTAVPVTEEVAQFLGAEAVVLYRPLPARSLNGLDLMRFGSRGIGKDVAALVAMGVAGGLIATIVPMASGLIFDTIIPHAELGQLGQVIGGLIMVALGTATFDLTKSVAMLRIEGRLDLVLQAAMFDRMLALPLPSHKNLKNFDCRISPIHSFLPIRIRMNGNFHADT